MDFKNKKLDNIKNKAFLFIFIIILVSSLIGCISASNPVDTDNSNANTILQANNESNSDNSLNSNDLLLSKEESSYEGNILSANKVIEISSKSTLDEIQTIIDNANSGDTIQFNDKEYRNISIIVNKKLNIVSSKNSIIYSSDSISTKAGKMGITDSFGFYFTSLASGSLIKGLTLTGNSDYGIIVDGADNININNNTISSGKKGGILIKDSSSNNINNNVIKDAYDGLILNNVNRTKINSNTICSNKHIGLVLENVFLNNATKNAIYKNRYEGVLLKDAKSNRILYNNITNNSISGLRLEGSTTRNVIMYNNISSNVVNIYANSLTNGDQMTHNTLMFARKDFENETYVAIENTGAAIVFGDDYASVKQGNLLFAYNSVGMNDVWDAKSTMSHPPVNIGANWYFDNDGNYAVGHICPMVFGRAITVDELKTLSMGFSQDGNGIIGQLFDGSRASGAGAFTIDNVNINGRDYGPYEVGTDGRFNLNLDKLPAGSEIKITINGHTFTVNIDDDIEADKTQNASSNSQKETLDSPKQETKKPLGEGRDNTIRGNGTGSGTGSLNGTGSGNGNFTGSGISVGDLSGESNSGTGDSGENGGGSASEGVNAYEILEQNPAPVAAKNSQVLALVAVFSVLLILALGYRSKNKDNENNF